MAVAVKQLRILVTNDDGVESPGIQALAAAVSDLGHDILVVAPLDDQSGVGSARAARIGQPIRTKVLDSGFIGIGGTPALAVTLARLGAGRHREASLAVQHGNVHLVAQAQLGIGQRQGAYEIGALAHEDVVGADLEDHVEVARGAAVKTPFTLARET